MNNLSIIINSCDRYSDIWQGFFTLFWKYWPDCPFPIYLGTGLKQYDDHRVHGVFSGDDNTWANSTRTIINQIPSDYILLFLEDFFLNKSVETKTIIDHFDVFNTINGLYLRLKPFPKPDKKVTDYPDLGEIMPGAPYRTALQAAIWHRNTLLNLLKDGENAWDMECFGSRRSDKFLTGFYSTWKPALHYEAGITLGKWLPWAVEQCQQEGVPIDTRSRAVLSSHEYTLWKHRVWRNKIINSIPWRTRQPIGNLLRKMKLIPPRVKM